MNNKVRVKKYFKIIVYIFAVIGFIMTIGFVVIKFNLTKVDGIVDKQHDYFKDQIIAYSNPAWKESEEWLILKVAIEKDVDDILRASTVADIDPRLAISPLVVEQLRLFSSDREIFKEIFSPLKILGTQNQFSWGVMGIKEDTAKQIEQNLVDKDSAFYLGEDYEHLLDFSTDNHDLERFSRLTNEKDRYYSYLYGALYQKQLIEQWKNSGIDISKRPEIISTLFNIGFSNSKPNPDPQTGGSIVNVGGVDYSFGGLAAQFYYSDELPLF